MKEVAERRETAEAFKRMAPASEAMDPGGKKTLPAKLTIKSAQRLLPAQPGCFISADKADLVRVGYTLGGVRKEKASSYGKWGMAEALLRCLR